MVRPPERLNHPSKIDEEVSQEYMRVEDGVTFYCGGGPFGECRREIHRDLESRNYGGVGLSLFMLNICFELKVLLLN